MSIAIPNPVPTNQPVGQMVEQLLAGDTRALSRVISLVENHAAASYRDEDTRLCPVAAHSVIRRSASCFRAWSSEGRFASSVGSASRGPAG